MRVEFIGGPCDGAVLEGEAAEGTVLLGGYQKLGEGAIGRRVVIPPTWTREILTRSSNGAVEQILENDERTHMHLIYQFECIDPYRLRFLEAKALGKK